MVAENVPVSSKVPLTFLSTIMLSFLTVPTIEPDAPEEGWFNVSSANRYALWIVVSFTTLSSLHSK